MRKAGKRAAKKTGSKRKTKAPLFTIGYEQASPAAVLGEITGAGIDLLVDIRAVAASRRPGFSKRQLAASLDEEGVGYVHLQKLGTPAEGRLAARAADYDRLWRIFDKHMKTEGARQQLDELVALVRSGKSIALLCYCRDPAHCHRSRVSALVKKRIGVKVRNLIPRLF
jgi:uncharacterized protein (DUF488 family)